MGDIAEIIGRLEHLTEPNRKLDFELLVIRENKPAESEPDWRYAHFIPLFTASIDAALTLVPEGMVAGVTTEGRAIVTKPTNYWEDDFGMGFCETGATPAIALCIATLRAREKQ